MPCSTPPHLRILAQPMGTVKVDASADVIQIQFVSNPPIDPMKIITLIQRKRHYKLSGPDRLRIDLKCSELTQRVLSIKNFFKELIFSQTIQYSNLIVIADIFR